MIPAPEVARVDAAYRAIRDAAGLVLWHLTGHDLRPDPPYWETKPPVDPALLDVGDGYQKAVERLCLAVPSAPEEFVACYAHELLAAVTGADRAPHVAQALEDLRAVLDELAAAISARDADHERRRRADQPPAKVNLSQIGRMVGMGRATVANWRRHHADFPPAIGGTAESPTFDRLAVAAWLTGRGVHIRWGAPEETPQE